MYSYLKVILFLKAFFFIFVSAQHRFLSFSIGDWATTPCTINYQEVDYLIISYLNKIISRALFQTQVVTLKSDYIEKSKQDVTPNC